MQSKIHHVVRTMTRMFKGAIEGKTVDWTGAEVWERIFVERFPQAAQEGAENAATQVSAVTTDSLKKLGGKMDGWVTARADKIASTLSAGIRKGLDFEAHASPSIRETWERTLAGVENLMGGFQRRLSSQLHSVIAGGLVAAPGTNGAGGLSVGNISIQGVLDDSFVDRALVPALERAIRMGRFNLEGR